MKLSEAKRLVSLEKEKVEVEKQGITVRKNYIQDSELVMWDVLGEGYEKWAEAYFSKPGRDPDRPDQTPLASNQIPLRPGHPGKTGNVDDVTH